MLKTYKVKNINEAVALGLKFQKEGSYNLFRGQAQNWEVIPSMGRLNKKELKEAQEKIQRLAYFYESEPTLTKYLRDIDWLYATAQHYGIPTSYLDFSSSVEIATYFATNSKSNKSGKDCAIVCLNEFDFKEFVEMTKSIYADRKVIAPYIARIDVDNLWRLQAQKGCFLFTPFNNLESLYPFDKIVFPYSEAYSLIPLEDIYPIAKSELEIMLDHYFNAEERLAGQKRFAKFSKEMNIPIANLKSPNISKALKVSKIHPSWDLIDNRIWDYKLKEVWKESLSRKNIAIHCKHNLHFAEFIEYISNQIKTLVFDAGISRDNILDFNVSISMKTSKKNKETLNRSCNRIWDGTRNLPFSNEEIASIISNYIYLELHDFKSLSTYSISQEKLVVLELESEYGSITRCYASPSKIILALRDDINEIIIDGLLPISNPEILLHINKPKLLFDFNKLLQLFKDEIIVYQVLYNSEKENPVIFYTPNQINVLGYA